MVWYVSSSWSTLCRSIAPWGTAGQFSRTRVSGCPNDGGCSLGWPLSGQLQCGSGKYSADEGSTLPLGICDDGSSCRCSRRPVLSPASNVVVWRSVRLARASLSWDAHERSLPRPCGQLDRSSRTFVVAHGLGLLVCPRDTAGACYGAIMPIVFCLGCFLACLPSLDMRGCN